MYLPAELRGQVLTYGSPRETPPMDPSEMHSLLAKMSIFLLSYKSFTKAERKIFS